MTDAIDGKVVLILGAGGIGSACARALGTRGALLAVVDIDDNKLRALAKSFEALDLRMTSQVVDITVFEQIAACVTAVVEKFGRLDVLINAAGVMYIRPVIEANIDEWNTTIDLNLKGTLWGVAAALPAFLKQASGHIISLGSVHGLKVSPGGAVHSASKFGVNAFSEGLRAELAQHAIRVTLINPGAVDTGLQDKSTGVERERLREIYAHAMSPDVVARAVTFAVELPESVVVNELVIRPTTQQI